MKTRFTRNEDWKLREKLSRQARHVRNTYDVDVECLFHWKIYVLFRSFRMNGSLGDHKAKKHRDSDEFN